VPTSGPSQQQHPRPSQGQQQHSQAQQALHNQQYANKPAPPLPVNYDPHGGRRLSPQMQPPANYGYNTTGSPPPGHGVGSPPPSSYGRPPPVQTRPPQQAISRPPPSPAPPNGADPTLWPLFKAVDKDGMEFSNVHLRYLLMILQAADSSRNENSVQRSLTVTGHPSILTRSV